MPLEHDVLLQLVDLWPSRQEPNLQERRNMNLGPLDPSLRMMQLRHQQLVSMSHWQFSRGILDFSRYIRVERYIVKFTIPVNTLEINSIRQTLA
jgi:hypothetical protein